MKWYAIHTRSRHEKQVDSFLRERGIDTFLPLVHTLSRRRDRKKYVDMPLFPGYMFVCTDKERLFDVKYTRGVTRIIGTDIDVPTPIPDKQILDLKSLAENNVQLDQFSYLVKGRAVRVKAGPLKGIEGILVERKGHYKLVIRIDLLQKGAAAEVFISDIDPI
ncbi:MAG: UpxY family transcription antiterminator [Candidatus Scalindua rubra]|uniref:Transcription antitermination protein NusG n=1 Tax=Candidatus Scalindua brodae TaxID=237368 RepID=A0A0B0EKM7_9BACT|nr:MAG: transcription antitermination protein NusG [Candidatus Scalindua brodae]MBZ0107859.1 UpxY family transcription antiterminator [Candidatus Scalindua rubra]TWU29176.1 Transcription antitermination protein RfaH [Candidatus Brocadiaceae bacterium S225]